MLGHSGKTWAATITTGWMIKRINCASAINPNTLPATRNPVV